MRSRRPLLLLVVASALAAGCGPDKTLSLDLRSVSITVPRLVTPAITLIPPAPQVVAPLPPLAPIDPGFTAPPAVPTAAPTVVTPPKPVACPKAGAFDVPAVTAAIEVTKTPAAASYLQVQTGGYVTPTTTGSNGGSIGETVTRLPQQTSSVGQVVDSWQVARFGPGSGTSSVEVYRLVHESDSPAATAPGIYLAAMAWTDPVRGDLSFQPVGDGLFLLPSPVTLSPSGGTQYAGSATDPSTLTTLSVVRNVTGKKRVDACGQLIDTYTVEMTGALTSPSAQRQVAWNLQLATSYGGLPVQDSLSLTEPAGTFSWNALRTATSLPKPVAP